MQLRVYKPPDDLPSACIYETETYCEETHVYRRLSKREYNVFKSSVKYRYRVEDCSDYKRLHLFRVGSESKAENVIRSYWQAEKDFCKKN